MATFGISRELVATLNYYYEKSAVETTLKYLFFKVPLEFPWIFEFQVILKLFSQQTRNSSIFRTRAILESLSIYSVNF